MDKETETTINRLVADKKMAVDLADYLINENVKLRKALRMWVKFWEADNSIDVGGDALLAEEAMEFTRELLGDKNV